MQSSVWFNCTYTQVIHSTSIHTVLKSIYLSIYLSILSRRFYSMFLYSVIR